MRRHILLAVCGLLTSLTPAFAQAAKTGADVVPSTSFAFFTARVSDLRDVEALKPVREAIAKLEKSEGSLEKILGVSLDEIDRLTFFWPAAPGNGGDAVPYIVVTTKGNYNEAKVLKALEAMPANRRNPKSGPIGAGAAFPAGAKAIEVPPLDIGPPAAPGILAPPPKEARPTESPPKSPPKALREEGAQVGDPPPTVKQPARAEPAEDAPAGGPDLFFRERGDYSALYLLDNRTILHIPAFDYKQEVVLNFLGQLLRRKADGPLAEALAEAGKHTIVAAARLQPIEEMIRSKGHFHGALVPFRSLFKAKTVMVTADVAAKTTVVAKLTFADAATAQRAEPVLKTLIQTGVDALADARKRVAKDLEWTGVLTPLIDLASTALEKADVKVDGAIVSARLDAEIGPAIAKAMAALPDLVEFASTRQKTLNNLKQIGLACHNYHDSYGYMPANIVGPGGKALMSWRVAILPFVEQDNMYRRLDLTKPWDDPNNAKILQKMPEVYRVYGREADKGKTYLQMPSSPQPVPGGNPFLVPGRRTGFNNIVDGTSNTIMVVEAADAVDWAKPDDLLFDPKKAPKVGDPSRKWFYALFGDAAVRTLPRDKLTDDQLRALMTIDGGEVVEIPDR